MLSNSLNVINSNECIGNSLSAINSNFSQIGLKVDQLEGTLGTSVSKIVAGSNITISPSNGTGVVTISSTINNNSIILSALNVGTTGAGIFKEKVGQNLSFKRLAPRGTNIEIVEENDVIRISAFDRNGSPGITTQNLGTGVGLAAPIAGGILPFKSITAGNGIRIDSGATTATIATNISGQNVGTGTGLYRSLSGANLTFKTLKGGTPNVVFTESPNEVSLHVLENSNAINIGTGAYVFKQKQGNDLIFKSLLSATPNVVITERAQDITIGVIEQTTGSNIGSGQGVVFAGKENNQLRFKTIKKGNNIQITDNGNEIQIDATLTGTGAGEVNAGRNVGPGTQIYKAKEGVDLVFRSLSAGPGIRIAQGTDTIVISAIPPVMGRGDVIGAFNEGVATNSVGVYTGVKTAAGFLNFKSLSGDSNVVLSQNSTNVNISLSGVVKDARNTILGTGTGEIYRTQNNGLLDFRKLRAGPGMSIITGTHDVIISSTLQASLDSLTTSYKNKIINGNFDIWQWSRGTVLSEVNGTASTVVRNTLTDSNNFQQIRFLADRWGFFSGIGLVTGSGTQAATFSKRVVSVGDMSALPARPKFYARIALNSRATTPLQSQIIPTTLFYRIENIFALAGKTVTLSFYARSNNVGSSNVDFYFGRFYKTIPPVNFESYKNNLQNVFQLSNDWQRYSYTFTIPNINSRTGLVAAWGENWDNPENEFLPFDNSFSEFVFAIPGAEGRYVDLTSVQLEEGRIATSFEPRPESVELDLCQRYFEVGDSFITQIGVLGNNLNKTEIPFKNTKRTIPLMSTDTTRTVLYQNRGTNTTTNISNHTFANISTTHARTSYTATDNLVITTPYVYNWAANAEFTNVA